MQTSSSKLLLASVAWMALTAGTVTNALAIDVAEAAPAAVAPDAPIGRITAAFGVASIRDAKGSHAGDLHALVKNDDRIVTDGGGVSLLLASRVVVKVDAASCISVRDNAGQTSIALEYGTVHVYVGQRPTDYGSVTLVDPQSKIETSDAVFLASYNPKTRQAYYACEHATINLKARDTDKVCVLNGDQQASVLDGKLEACGQVDRLAYMDHQRSLNQLGQSVVEQGADVFRLRSRTFDTQVALSQLSAAGWIDAQTLSKTGSSSTLAKKKKGSTADGSTSTKGDSSTGDTETNTTSGTSTVAANSSNASAGSNGSGNTTAENTVSAPAAPTPVTITDAGGSNVGSSGSSNSGSTGGSTPAPGTVVGATPVAANNDSGSGGASLVDLGLGSPTDTQTGNSNDNGIGAVDGDNDGGHHGKHGHGGKDKGPDRGPGKGIASMETGGTSNALGLPSDSTLTGVAGSAAGSGVTNPVGSNSNSTVVTSGVTDSATSGQPTLPQIDLGLGGPKTGAAGAASDVNSGGGKATSSIGSSVTSSATTTIPKADLDLGSSKSVATGGGIDLGLGGASNGIATSVTHASNAAGGIGGLPKNDITGKGTKGNVAVDLGSPTNGSTAVTSTGSDGAGNTSVATGEIGKSTSVTDSTLPKNDGNMTVPVKDVDTSTIGNATGNTSATATPTDPGAGAVTGAATGVASGVTTGTATGVASGAASSAVAGVGDATNGALPSPGDVGIDAGATTANDAKSAATTAKDASGKAAKAAAKAAKRAADRAAREAREAAAKAAKDASQQSTTGGNTTGGSK